MVKHIVMWRLKSDVSKAEKAEEIRQALEGLQGRIPGLLNIEVGIDFSCTQQSADVVLCCDLENREALNEYQAHPLHQAVVPLVKAATCERIVVDYDV